MNDVVYILGNGSTCGNAEIKYSLRSIEKHLEGFRNVFIIGTKPFFLNEVAIEIPFKDIHRNKARNIMAKVSRASQDERISENFMFFNDDYFLLKNFSANEYPFYYKTDIKQSILANVGEYEKHLKETLQALEEKNLEVLNFDVHKPIIYNKEMFLEMQENFNWNRNFGLVLKSTYCNYHKIKGVFEQDCKISHPYTIEHIRKMNVNRELFSTGEKAINVHMQKYFKELYPNKSRFEK